MRKAFKLLLINSEDADFAIKHYKRHEEDIFIFKNGVFRQNNKDSKRLNPGNSEIFTVLFNGNWIPRKGTDTLVKAASSLNNKGYMIRYLIIGTGKDKAELIHDWPVNLHDMVDVVRNFQPEKESDFLNETDLFVLPSYFEGQPLSLLQAMANETCCVTTGCCGQKDIIRDGETGFLFSPGDHAALSDIIENCYNNRNKCLDVARNAEAEMKSRDWETVSDQLADYIITTSLKYREKHT